jgi:hypothetical protein
LLERRDAALIFQIVRGWTQEHSDPPPLWFLRARRERPRRRGASE